MRRPSRPAFRFLGLLVGAALLAPATAFAVAAEGGKPPQFSRDVLPILAANCLQCHGSAVKMGGLDLRTSTAMATGGKGGAALVKGDARRSTLYRRAADGSMPPGNARKLTPAELRVLEGWIQAGAPGDGVSAGGAHWAFVPPKRPLVPRVRQAWWVRNPVDAFVLSRLERAGIRPPKPADRRTLVRRLYLDLIGLPPTPEEARAFVEDRRPDAYDRLVDGLLSRPQYGERWARKWLDVARYAETNGYERDGAKPNAWRYRDYVIDSFNRDKPFDRFLVEQVAGDEVEGSNAETQIATTFLRLGTWDDEPAEPVLDRYEQLDDILGTTSSAFLGITLRCARCHDHKFEPFSQKEYYEVLAAFQPLKRPQNGRQDLDRLVGTAAELKAYHAAMARADAEVASLQAPLTALKQSVHSRLVTAKSSTLPTEALEALGTPAEKLTDPQKALVKQHAAQWEKEIRETASDEERARLEELEKRIAAVNAARPAEPPRAYVWYEEEPEAPPTRLLRRGDPAQPGDEVRPGLPAVLVARQPEAPRPLERSTGRRLWLARWMASPQNPLTARVIVNRAWGWHFGEGLVATENDFGTAGQRPSDPLLLDWLAVELTAPTVKSGSIPPAAWSLKRLHRLIVTSNTYKAAPDWDSASAGKDAGASLPWRWKPRRLEAEVVRDSALAVSGQLNPQMGGPSVYPAIPRAVLEGQSRPGDGWGKSDEREAARRSVYIFVKRSLAVPELEVLDAPDTTSSCEQRLVSTIAPQALTFLNGDFMNEQAHHFGARLEREAGPDPAGRVRRAFELAFSRAPSDEELRRSLRFLEDNERQVRADTPGMEAGIARRAALEAFCLVLLNSNELFYLR